MIIKTPPIKWHDLKDGIEIKLPERTIHSDIGMTDLFRQVVTIYNDIPEANNTARHWDRHIINYCNIQEQKIERANGNILNISNAKTVVTKDIANYVNPDDYVGNGYTVRVGDFVVFGEVEDVVLNAQGFMNLQKKYADNGFKITTVNVGIFGMSSDNIMMTNG